MKTMIVSDFAALRSALLQLVGICLVVSLFMSYVMGAVGTSAAIGAMIPFMCLFSLAALDEQNGWERFRLTLPITRRQAPALPSPRCSLSFSPWRSPSRCWP